LYPADPASPLQKSPRPSTFSVDLDHDVRVLASLRGDLQSWRVAHREFTYAEAWVSAASTQKLPLRRIPANPLVRDTTATWIGLGAIQPVRLQAERKIASDKVPDPMQVLLHQALNFVTFMPFAGGTMAGFERALYAEAEPVDTLNARYWALVQRWQGIQPPAARSERWADALTRPQVNENPGAYALHALSIAAVFHLHEAAATKVGGDVWTVDLANRPEVGRMLQDLWAADVQGKPFLTNVKDVAGAELSAQAMIRYFKPLQDWLVVQNVGRTAALPNL
jgi:peptidyl-dipeptidase A